jgi:plastocyanin
LTIHATNFSFSPNSVVVASGTTVTVHFVNDDQAVPHNIAFDIGELQFTTPCPGPCTADLTFTAPAPGQYSFSCSVHPFMTGTLIVN